MAQKFGSFQGTNNVMYLNHSGSVSTGDIWFDHGNSAIKIYNGTSWDEVGSGSGGGGVSYSVSTSNVTATANQGIIADTSGGSFTVTLPASPSTGDKVFIADGADFATNNLTVARNGSTIEGTSEDFILDVGGPNVGFIYDGTTWQVYPQSGLMSIRGIEDNSTSTAITINSSQDVSFSGNVTLGYVDGDFYVTDSSTTNGYVQIGEKYIYGLDNVGGGSFNIQSNGASYFTGGNVGIGTTSPDAVLHTSKTQASGDVPVILENSGTSGVATASLVFAGNGGGGAEKARIKSAVYGDGYMAFHTNNDSEKMRLDASGNLGLGTTNPTAYSGQTNLNINSGSVSRIDLDISDSLQGYLLAESTYMGLIANTGNFLMLGANNAESARIDGSGNLIVGSTSIDAASSVSLKNEGSIRSVHASGAGGDSLFGAISGVSNGYQINIDTSNNQTYTWHNGGAVSMRIDSSGNVGIGTTSPSSYFSSKLVVHTTDDDGITIVSNTTGAGFLSFADGTSGNERYRGYIGYDHSTDTFNYLSHGDMRFYTGSTTPERMRLEADGDLHVDGDVIAYSTTISDQRLKDNVETIDKALDKVTSLRGVTYTWNTGSREGKSDLGVIAQEVEAIIPEIVHDKEMALVDGETYKTVDYEKLTALLIEAIKELKAEVDELKASK